MLTHELSSLDQNTEGVYVVVLDEKHRFTIPSDWRNSFSHNEKLVIAYTGNYGILVKKSIFEENDIEPGIIIHQTRMDKMGRVIIPSNFLKTYDISLEDTVGMIGKQNHIELYFQKEHFNATKLQALRSAIQLQADLLTRKH